ncbi:DUF3473 domain-containing protein [Desulfovermiculus halophilus]|uniref:DUF3473 domain-containing protein n=1 Tax=Desulfovermiculus halophilus TaxID=339722 RepID=UPI0006881622|nr:DUF3473 domain-containing protein [Desulfovermiculus halophilus]
MGKRLSHGSNRPGISPQNRRERISGPKATFFFLAWVARRFPRLVQEVHERGHEVASHGCNHMLLSQMSSSQIFQDLYESKQILEDITGSPVLGYRAPSFSIALDHFDLLEKAGYAYDSSYNSFALHKRYGRLDLTRFCQNGIAYRINKNFAELPVSNLRIRNIIFPWGGGGYFRLLAPAIFYWGVRRIMSSHGGFVFYLHPWELDPEQPKARHLSAFSKFKHYVNLEKTSGRLLNFVKRFEGCSFVTCGDYLKG